MNRSVEDQQGTPESVTTTTTVETTDQVDAGATTLKLRLVKGQQRSSGEEAVPPPAVEAGEPSRQVTWSEGTVDNEDLGRKKSKCCCIYVKPKRFDQSDTESSSDEGSGGGDPCDCLAHSSHPKSKGPKN